MRVHTVESDTRAANVLNPPTRQGNVPTPLRVKKLASWLNLAGYDSGKKSELITGLSEGFSQHYEGPDLSSEAILK